MRTIAAPLRLATLVALFCVVAAPARAQDGLRLDPATLVRVEALLAAQMEEHHIPGLSASIVTPFGEWSGALGSIDLEAPRPATRDSVFRLASISKPITATAVMLLVEDGKIDLDAPVQRYVPSFPHQPWPITVRRLLGHQGGIRHYQGAEIDNRTRYASVTEALRIFQADDLVNQPGTAYRYTTYGYNLLGAIVEGAAGVPFMQFVEQHIIAPAGMATLRPFDLDAGIPHLSRGYQWNQQAGTIRPNEPVDTTNKIPGGGLCSTSADLTRFARALLDGRLVRPETREQMFTRGLLRDGSPTGYGLGWNVRELDGRRAVAHGGGQQGVATYLLLLPEERVAVAIMTNRQGAPASAIAAEVARLVLPTPAE